MEANLQRQTGTSTLIPSTVLREQPKPELLKLIANHLDKIAKLFQIPNWDSINGMLLAEWIVETYQTEQVETLLRCLNKPRRMEDKTWRLTPDVITDWMSQQIELEAEKREKEIHNAKQAEGLDIEVSDERIQEWLDTIKNAPGFKPPAPLTPEDILKEGQLRPEKEKKWPVTTREELVNHIVHLEWIKANFDPITGKPLETFVSEDEWIKMQG